MGRISKDPGFDESMILVAKRSPWVDGDYDSGGAYWGNSGHDSIYAVWERGHGDCGVVYVRAISKAQAVAKVLGGWKAA